MSGCVCVCLCVREREREREKERKREKERERARGMEDEKERQFSQDQAVALSARCARLGRRVHRSAHIMCIRALSLCAVFRSLRRSHAPQVESISVSKSAHARGAGGGKKREA